MPTALEQAVSAPAEVGGEQPNFNLAIEERRECPRSDCEVHVATRRKGRAEAPTHGAIVRDASETGIGLLAPRAYDVGTTLLVWREGRHPREAIVAEVVHCRREAAGWFHGCKRLDPTSS
jgi:hypothetical protein